MRQTPGIGRCAIEGCAANGRLTRGWCQKHYQRWQTHSDPLVSDIDREQTGRTCRVDGCGRKSGYRGFCQNHYVRWKLAPERFARAAKHAEIGELTDTEAAYIAGMIDADGVVTVGAGKRPSPVVLVTNSNFGLIEWLLSKICAGSAYETKAAPKRPDQNAERWNKVHRHQLTGRKAQTLLSRCRPYMLVKARQADLVTQLPTRGRDFGRVATAGQREFAGQIKSQVRALNARGRRPDHVI